MKAKQMRKQVITVKKLILLKQILKAKQNLITSAVKYK